MSLEGQFFYCTDPEGRGLQDTDNFAKADGIIFLCPKCFDANSGPIGTHSIMVCFADGKAPPTLGLNDQGQTVRWTRQGTGYADLVCRPSIHLPSGCGWHGYIGGADGSRPGEVLDC